MTIKKKLILTSILATGIFAIVGCSLSTSSTGTETPAASNSTGQINGTVSNGAPSRNARVSIKSMKDGSAIKEAITNALGAYTVTVPKDKAPFLIKAVDSKGKSNFSFVKETGGTANVNQLSSLSLMLASKVKPADLFKATGTRFTTTLKTSIENNLAKAKEAIARVMAGFYKDAGVASTVDPITTPITAFNIGFDKVLDAISVSFSATATTAEIKSAIDSTVSLASLASTVELTNVGTALDLTSQISQARVDTLTSAINNIVAIKSMVSSFLSVVKSSSVSAGTLSTFFTEISGKTFSGFSTTNLVERAVNISSKVSALSEGISMVSTVSINNKIAYEIKFFTILKDGGIALNAFLNTYDTILVQKANDDTWKFISNNENASIGAKFRYTYDVANISISNKSFDVVFKVENKTSKDIDAVTVNIPELTGVTSSFSGVEDTSKVSPIEKFSVEINATNNSSVISSLSASSSDEIIANLIIRYADTTTENRLVTLPKRVITGAYPSKGNFPSVTVTGHSTSYLKNGSLSFGYSKPTSFLASFIEASLYKGDSMAIATKIASVPDLSLSSSSAQMTFTTLTVFDTKYILKVTAFNPEENESFSTIWFFDPSIRDFSTFVVTDSTFSGKNLELANSETASFGTTFTLKVDKSYTVANTTISGTWAVVNNRLVLSKVFGTETLQDTYTLFALNTSTQRHETYVFSVNSGTGSTRFIKLTDTPVASVTTSAGELPAAVKGKVLDFTYSFVSKTSTFYAKDEVVNFTFSSSGTLFIKKSTDILSKDVGGFTLERTEYLWKDSSKGLSYMLSILADGSINEINLFTTPHATAGNFLGSFKLAVDTTETNASLPSTISGQTIATTWTETKSGAPYKSGDQKSFEFNANGTLTEIHIFGNRTEIATSFTKKDGIYTWVHGTSNNKYSLSVDSADAFTKLEIFSAVSTVGKFGEFLKTQ
ncbi:MAG: hypothetical protein COB02_05950 [Candidatus Cloacimonadota bacterium]|nr:MAG: hypothetical protein COB02_12140 [Candidatus Cloacimonadota bacterium]PCJ20141.1 MAG: hypothetical protein COB02_05950 [Candidatus Cloacimonadota bacterium]